MSTSSLFSEQWHRVRDVYPQLASDVTVSRHVYRGRTCYALRRRATSAIHHLDSVSFELVDRLDGETSVAELWDRAIVERDQQAPTQDELIGLLGDLYAAELLVVDRRVPEERLFEKRSEHNTLQRRQRYLNPLYLRFALYDPDPLLNKLAPISRHVFSRGTGLIWLALMVCAGLSMLAHSDELWGAIQASDIFSSRNALLLLLLYPVIKLLHELAHALAVKRCGGEVHETGLSLMVLLPLPYVDASASAMFANKFDRMLVSSAGILVELACAAVGVLIWTHTSGSLADFGLLMFLVGGVSTVLLNGNPLLKFDGYYLLADWLEIPNLSGRSRRAVISSLRTLVSGADEATTHSHAPVEDRVERVWLHVYGVCSAVYRTALMLWIAWMLSEKWFFVGVMLAVTAIVFAVGLPLLRCVKALFKDPVYRTRRSLVAAGAIPLVLTVAMVWLPLPHSDVVTGVIWIPDDAVIRVNGDCDVTAVHAAPGESVKAGDALFTCEEIGALAAVDVLVARTDELQTRLASATARDPLSAVALKAEIKATELALVNARERFAESTLMAKSDGVFDVTGTTSLHQRAFSRGDLAGYVVPEGQRTVRMAIDERWITRFDTDLESVELRVKSANGDARDYTTTVLRRTPKATRVVASAALSTFGGGTHLADENGDGRLLKESVFDVELVWPEVEHYAAVGAHVGVRLVYSATPLSTRLSTALRHAFSDRVSS